MERLWSRLKAAMVKENIVVCRTQEAASPCFPCLKDTAGAIYQHASIHFAWDSEYGKRYGTSRIGQLSKASDRSTQHSGAFQALIEELAFVQP
jgi:hypothetical protein